MTFARELQVFTQKIVQRSARAEPELLVSIGRVERRLAAVLTADVAGYSRLMSADELGTESLIERLGLPE